MTFLYSLGIYFLDQGRINLQLAVVQKSAIGPLNCTSIKLGDSKERI